MISFKSKVRHFILIGTLFMSNLMGADKNKNLIKQQENILEKEEQKLSKEYLRINYTRGEDQTYLTYPEWFLVYSPKEYAEFLKTNPSSDFSYFTHLKQFWGSYYDIYQATKDKYSFNSEYHIMINVIGISTSIEYGIKSIYGNTISKLVQLIDSKGKTSEEELGANVAKEYVDFIENVPWYEFDFYSKFKDVWKIPFFEKGFIRQTERKMAMSIEYLVKASYGWIIGKASAGSFDKPSLETICIVDNNYNFNDIKMIKKLDKDIYLTSLPRYQDFTTAAIKIAKMGGNFKEIAGNKDFIMLSLLITEKEIKDFKKDTLFKYGRTTDSRIRVMIRVEIKELSNFIRENKSLYIEHIYDF